MTMYWPGFSGDLELHAKVENCLRGCACLLARFSGDLDVYVYWPGFSGDLDVHWPGFSGDLDVYAKVENCLRKRL